MAVQTTLKKVDDSLPFIYEQYQGNVTTSDIIGSLIQSVVQTATDQIHFILSNWQNVTNAEFSTNDILSAVEGAFSVDLIDRHMFIAFVLKNNPHLEYLAEVFMNSVDKNRIHVKIFENDEQALMWFQDENIK